MPEWSETLQTKEQVRLVAWPSPQDYNEAVQNPPHCFTDEELRRGEPELNALGLPKPASGNFASVYRLRSGGKDYAVRCFLHPLADQQQRYRALSHKLHEIKAPYLVKFEFLEKAIRIGAELYPIVRMDWVSGVSLIRFVNENLREPDALRLLADSFKSTVLSMKASGIAHGDLQHGNLIVDSGKIKLVDYDGFFVPALSGMKSNELGHRNYQHPRRSPDDFDASLDRFSAWVIWISLMALAEDSTLWAQLHGGDECLLFRKVDFTNPTSAKPFHLMENHSSLWISLHARFLRSLLAMKPSDVPSLDVDVVAPTNLPPLTAHSSSQQGIPEAGSVSASDLSFNSVISKDTKLPHWVQSPTGKVGPSPAALPSHAPSEPSETMEFLRAIAFAVFMPLIIVAMWVGPFMATMKHDSVIMGVPPANTVQVRKTDPVKPEVTEKRKPLAVTLSPSYAAGTAAFKKQHYPAAQAYLMKALRLDAKKPSMTAEQRAAAYCLLGVSCAKQDLPVQARDYLSEARWRYGLLKMTDKVDAIDAAIDQVESMSESGKRRYSRAKATEPIQEERPIVVKPSIDDANNNPAMTTSQAYLAGTSAFKDHRYGAAQAFLQTALTLDANKPELASQQRADAYHLLGHSFEKLGLRNEAVSNLREARWRYEQLKMRDKVVSVDRDVDRIEVALRLHPTRYPKAQGSEAR